MAIPLIMSAKAGMQKALQLFLKNLPLCAVARPSGQKKGADIITKVIFETALLTNEQIKDACELSKSAGMNSHIAVGQTNRESGMAQGKKGHTEGYTACREMIDCWSSDVGPRVQ
jgi:hypothetical protein